MSIAHPSRIESAEDDVGYYDTTPSLGYLAFAILLLIAVIWVAKCCGTALRSPRRRGRPCNDTTSALSRLANTSA